MNIVVGSLASAVLLISVGACGSDAEVGDSARVAGTSPAPSSSASGSESAADTVTSVVVRRSGGLKSGPVARSFVAGQVPPKGFTSTEQEVVIVAAQSFIDAGVSVPELPANTCCDRFIYTVEITTSDGSTTTYAALQGQPQPRLFAALLVASS